MCVGVSDDVDVDVEDVDNASSTLTGKSWNVGWKRGGGVSVVNSVSVLSSVVSVVAEMVVVVEVVVVVVVVVTVVVRIFFHNRPSRKGGGALAAAAAAAAALEGHLGNVVNGDGGDNVGDGGTHASTTWVVILFV